MSDFNASHLKLGHPVPDFEIDTYEPSIKNFGKISLAEQKLAGKWTIMFFYPADFTFV
jgi:peroxiredoxin (alkyl hydroperoxide reductase subunit C)